MIELNDVSKTYENGVQALKNVSLHIEPGEFVFIVGASGAGKSTFLKTLLREEIPTSGSVTVNGYDLVNIPKKEIPIFRRTMGVVFQDFRLIPNLSVFDNAAFAMRVIGASEKEIRKRVPYVLSLVGLASKARCMPDELSGGERQRVALARALVNNAAMIIADEPTGNVDPELSYEIVDLLNHINETGTTVVMVTHEHELVKHFNHRVVVVENGEIVSDTKNGDEIKYSSKNAEMLREVNRKHSESLRGQDDKTTSFYNLDSIDETAEFMRNYISEKETAEKEAGEEETKNEETSPEEKEAKPPKKKRPSQQRRAERRRQERAALNAEKGLQEDEKASEEAENAEEAVTAEESETQNDKKKRRKKAKSSRKRSLSYLTKEGVHNVWSNRMMSMASVAVLVSCLTIIGCAAMLFFNVEAMLDKVGDQNVIMAFVDDNIDETATKAVGEDLKNLGNISSVVFVSKEEAWKEQVESLGSDAAVLEGLENPLPNAYKVTVENLETFDATAQQVKNVTNVMSVLENSKLAGQLLSMSKSVTLVSAGIIFLLFLVSFFIVSNTVRITMYTRRLEIKIMKSVGATNRFIRWPFMIEGIILGIISVIVSLALVAAVYAGASNVFGSMVSVMGGTMVKFSEHFWQMLICFTAVGVFTGIFGSAVSMNKYLKEQKGESDEI